MKKLIVAVLAIAVTAAPATAQAGPIKWSESDVICATTQIGNTAYGLETALPSVYAYNMRRGIRERQKVGMQFAIDLWYPGQGWKEQYRTPWYYAYAWDYFPAQAWVNSSDGSVLKSWEKMQWSLNLAGAWRVYIRVWHGSNRYRGWSRTGWKIPVHSGNRDGRTDYCLVG